MAFYQEFEESGGECIGYGGWQDYDRILCVCDTDNYASEAVILKNGGVLENELFDPEENVTVKRYWIDLR